MEGTFSGFQLSLLQPSSFLLVAASENLETLYLESNLSSSFSPKFPAP